MDIDMRPIVRKRILDRDGHECRKCGSIQNLHIDHIIPLSRGGREDECNMQVLCRTCNLRKHNSIDIKPYVRLGIDPEYFEIRQDFPTQAFSSVEFALLIASLWERNDYIFGIERTSEYAEDKRRLLYEGPKSARKRYNARSASR